MNGEIGNSDLPVCSFGADTPPRRRGIKAGLLPILILFFASSVAFAQVDEARQAIDRGEMVVAVNLLSEALAHNPTADTYLYLGIAYAGMKEYEKAEDTLQEGSDRFNEDPRFHNELARVYRETHDDDKARAELRHALQVDPHNSDASDMLAFMDLTEGEVQTALKYWNRSGRPIIDDILHNYYLSFGSWVVRDAIAFQPTDILHYNQWKTTEARLIETRNFTNVGLEVEPTKNADHYSAIIKTATKTNSLKDFAWNALKGTPVATSYLDVWNIGNSGLNWNSNYRWDVDRRRVEGKLSIPVPIPGLLHVEISDTWRAERWDISPNLKGTSCPQSCFDYRANSMRLELKRIFNYRLEAGGGFSYANRFAHGTLPQLATDSRNIGKLFLETSVRVNDGVYQNRLHLEGFTARKTIVGDFNLTGGTAELNNRITISKDTRTYLDWAIKGGTLRGQPPVEDYFVLGMDLHPENLLRGHTAADHGRYGLGPMATDFFLGNLDLDRKIVTMPMFDNFNLPYIVIKGFGFFDIAKTWDRTRIFQPSKLLMDSGAGLRFETPANSFNVVYGKSLRDGKAVLFGYIERRLW